MAGGPAVKPWHVTGSDAAQAATTYGDEGVILGAGRPSTFMDTIAVVGGATFLSTVIVPANARAVLVGVSYELPLGLVAAGTLAVGATIAGDPVLGTADQAILAFTQVTPSESFPAASPIQSRAASVPSWWSQVTREGDGANPLWQAIAALAAGEQANVRIFYYLASLANRRCS